MSVMEWVVTTDRVKNLNVFSERQARDGSFYFLDKFLLWCQRERSNPLFVCNGGMWNEEYPDNLQPIGWEPFPTSPKAQGLVVSNGRIENPLDTQHDGSWGRLKGKHVNFWHQPNGVFYVTKQEAPAIKTTQEAEEHIPNMRCATQSGPMLVINGSIHPEFTSGSHPLMRRIGVGVRNGEVVFLVSEDRINFYNFAEEFLKRGCENALYFDGGGVIWHADNKTHFGGSNDRRRSRRTGEKVGVGAAVFIAEFPPNSPLGKRRKRIKRLKLN